MLTFSSLTSFEKSSASHMPASDSGILRGVTLRRGSAVLFGVFSHTFLERSKLFPGFWINLRLAQFGTLQVCSGGFGTTLVGRMQNEF